MKREYVVLLYSLIVCGMLYWITPKENMSEYSILWNFMEFPIKCIGLGILLFVGFRIVGYIRRK